MPANITQNLFHQLGAIQAVVYGVAAADGNVYSLATDTSGNLSITSGAANLPVVDASTGAVAALAPLFGTQACGVDGSGNLRALKVDVSGNLLVTGGTGGGGGSNAAASATGSAVPTNASYTGFNSSGNLVGVSTVNPFPVSLTSTAVTGSVAVTGTFYPYSLGQQLAAASIPVVLTAAQITSLTPPAVFNGIVTNAGTFATQSTLNAETTKVIGTVNLSAAQTVGLVAGAAVIGHVINDASTAVIGHVIVDTAPTTTVTGTVAFSNTTIAVTQATAASLNATVVGTGTFAVQAAATLNAETTKVIGTVNVSAAQTIAVTQATAASLNTTAVIASGTVTAVTSITNAVTVAQATAANLNATVTQQTLTKGTQGATGVTTQDLKDAGRVMCTFTASAVAGVTTEALITLTPYRDLVAGTAATTFAVTSGKRLRLQSILVTWRNNTAVAGGVTVRFRTLAGTVLVSSPVQGSVNASTALATIGSGLTVAMPIPDGMELSGTMQFGLTQLAVGAVVGFDVHVIAYEY